MENSEYDKPMGDSWWDAVIKSESKTQTTRTSHKSQGRLSELGDNTGQLIDGIQTSNINWAHLNELKNSEDVITVRIVEFNRGGLLVEGEEIHGFLPFSHIVSFNFQKIDLNNQDSLAEYIGTELNVKLIEIDETRKRVVVSERAALAQPGTRKELFASLEAGSTIQGTVTNVTKFGVFVDLGGVEGLVHISEISWGRVSNPSEVLATGDVVQVLVLDVDKARDKIALSIKQLIDNPWESILARLPIGIEVSAVITSIAKFGAFAKLDDGLEGLIHVSGMDLSDDADPKEIVAVGEEVIVEILSVDIDKQRLSLRMK